MFSSFSVAGFRPIRKQHHYSPNDVPFQCSYGDKKKKRLAPPEGSANLFFFKVWMIFVFPKIISF